MHMNFKLLDTSTIEWHNVLKNPEDLPAAPFNLIYLCMIALPEDIVDNETVSSFGIVDCLYVRNQKKWYTLFNEKYPPLKEAPPLDDEPYPEISDEETLSSNYKWFEPAGKVVMWAEASSCYADTVRQLNNCDHIKVGL